MSKLLMTKLKRFLVIAGVPMTLFATTPSLAAGEQFTGGNKLNNYWEDPKAWREAEVEPPAFPLDANLAPIYVSAVATNQYLIDKTSLSVGADGVIRYALVVLTAGGAKNISFEGMRCDTRQWKTYAIGRAAAEGGTWAAVRSNEWREVENKPVNRHHAAISKDYFCPNGSTIQSAEEGRDALERGGHPRVPGSSRQ